MTALDIYQRPGKYPRLLVQQFVIKRAVRGLHRAGEGVDALALIRGAYSTADGANASLDEAKEILDAILRE